MTREDWFGVLDQGAGVGVRAVQMVGGEPTMHPDFGDLVEHALTLGLTVEVFSNLVHVSPANWDLFQRPGVRLATSYYSDDEAEHNAITGRDSHRKTRANIARALELGIPVRTGVIAVQESQRVQQARADLKGLGIAQTGTYSLRHFGRGQGEHPACDLAELCGRCGDGRAAIGPDGAVSPCIMSGWLKAGSVRTTPLADILSGEEMAGLTATIPTRLKSDPCGPDDGPCGPSDNCAPDAYPCYPSNE